MIFPAKFLKIGFGPIELLQLKARNTGFVIGFDLTFIFEAVRRNAGIVLNGCFPFLNPEIVIGQVEPDTGFVQTARIPLVEGQQLFLGIGVVKFECAVSGVVTGRHGKV